MLNRLRLFVAVICATACSVANALQPISRAGSISMNAGVKPASTAITSTTSTPAASGNININTNRGSAVSKFTPNVVTVAGNTNNNPGTSGGVSSQDLQDLQNQINDLIDAQQNQVTREYVEETVETNISRLNVPAIRTTVSDIQSTTQNLSESVNAIQQRTNDYENTLNQDVDNRLKVRGLIDNNNQIPFAKKSDIEPTILAQNIVADTAATATLADKIQPKDSDIRSIITDELTDVGVLKNDGTLDVEKKGQVVVSEATVTNALRDSQNFKNMVSDEVATKGYVTETALNSRDFVTNTALDAKKFVTSDSDTIKNLATKSEITPVAIATSIAGNDAATAALTGKVGPDATAVNDMIVQKLKDNDILTTTGTLNVARNRDITPENIATAIAGNETAKQTLSGKIGPNTTHVNDIITTKLKDKGILSNDNNETLQLATKTEVAALDNKFALKGEVATDESFTNLSNTVSNLRTKVDGDIETPNSLLYNIKNNETLRNALKGEPGQSVNLSDVTSALKSDANFLNAVKGEKGDAGSSFSLKRNISSTSELPTCTTAKQSHAYYNTTDELLYICGCDDNDVCNYISTNFRGAKGDPGTPAKSVEQTYCEENYAIVSALYSDIIKSESDCASKFTNAHYTAILGGAKSYCLSLTQKTRLDLSTGIGKKLVSTFGSEKMADFNNASSQNRIKLPGFKASKDASTTTDFMTACEARYNEIMAGDDAETAWHAYCEANAEGLTNTKNLVLIQKLYPDANISTCDDFTQAQYAAIIGGADAFCMSLTKNFNTVSLNNGIGLKMAKLYATKNSVTLDAAKTQLGNIKNATVLDRFDTSKRLFGTTSLNQACIDNYNAIMSGEDGDDGETAWHAYCNTPSERDSSIINLDAVIRPLYGNDKTCDNFSSTEYNAIMGGARAYCLSLVQSPTKLVVDDGIGRKLETSLGSGTIDLLKNTSTLKERMTLKTFGPNKNMDFVSACEAKYNEIMSGDDGTPGDDGKSAAEIWCEAHLMKNNTVAVRLSPAKMARAYDKIKNINQYVSKINIGDTSGNGGYFTDMNACLAAVAADPDLIGGESEADQKFNELQKAEIQKGSFVLANAASGLNNLRTNFRDTYLKGAAGADGTTFTPSFNATTGQLSWTSSKSDVSAPAAMKVAKTDSELNTLALTAVKTGLGGSSTDNLSDLVQNKAITMDDLANYINAGLLVMDSNNKLKFDTTNTITVNSAQRASFEKIAGKTNGTIYIDDGLGQCSVGQTGTSTTTITTGLARKTSCGGR